MRRADIEVPNPAVDRNSRAGSACYPQGSFYPLSDGPSIRNRRITSTDFRPCSTCQSHSQATLYTCARTGDFHPPRGDLCAPPLLFRRRPPQSNCPPDSVPLVDSDAAVRISAYQGWYPNVDSTTTKVMASMSPTYPVHDMPKSSIRLQ